MEKKIRVEIELRGKEARQFEKIKESLGVKHNRSAIRYMIRKAINAEMDLLRE